MTTRREFLMQGTASAAALTLPGTLTAQTSQVAELKARTAAVQLAPAPYPKTEIWGYGGTMPGPELRIAQGDRVRRRFLNDLPQASSVHWHGIRIDNAMDGVAGLTQDAVAPGGSFDYDFVVPDAGTYWYHAHNRSWEQVARGLYGALIVEEAEAPDVDREEVLILDDWLLDPETAQIDDSFDNAMMMSHGGRMGNFLTTNGRFDLSLGARRHERLRLRLINASNARTFLLQFSGLAGWTVALDGMPLMAPAPLEEVLVLGAAQRADLVVDVTAEDGETAYILRIGDDDQVTSQVMFPVSGTASRARRDIPARLPPNPVTPKPDFSEARRLRLVMAGGAMGRMDGAFLGGERLGFRELVENGRYWSFNEMAEMTQTPLAGLSLGEPVRLEIVNDTVFPHAMHLHGMHFHEIKTDGNDGPMRDTLMIRGGETREIAFVADNPGDWLFHCHMLSHAETGMMTWIQVT